MSDMNRMGSSPVLGDFPNHGGSADGNDFINGIFESARDGGGGGGGGNGPAGGMGYETDVYSQFQATYRPNGGAAALQGLGLQRGHELRQGNGMVTMPRMPHDLNGGMLGIGQMNGLEKTISGLHTKSDTHMGPELDEGPDDESIDVPDDKETADGQIPLNGGLTKAQLIQRMLEAAAEEYFNFLKKNEGASENNPAVLAVLSNLEKPGGGNAKPNANTHASGGRGGGKNVNMVLPDEYHAQNAMSTFQNVMKKKNFTAGHVDGIVSERLGQDLFKGMGGVGMGMPGKQGHNIHNLDPIFSNTMPSDGRAGAAHQRSVSFHKSLDKIGINYHKYILQEKVDMQRQRQHQQNQQDGGQQGGQQAGKGGQQGGRQGGPLGQQVGQQGGQGSGQGNVQQGGQQNGGQKQQGNKNQQNGKGQQGDQNQLGVQNQGAGQGQPGPQPTDQQPRGLNTQQQNQFQQYQQFPHPQQLHPHHIAQQVAADGMGGGVDPRSDRQQNMDDASDLSEYHVSMPTAKKQTKKRKLKS